jgi:predicted dehydrogenase
MAMDFEEAQKMVEAAEEFGVLFGVAYYRRLFPKLLRAKRLIGEGAIGQPVLAEANCHGWLESEERGWLRDPALAGGGPLYDIASHRIDAMNFLFGRPRRALGLLSNTVHSLEVEDSATVTIQYDGGIHGVVDVRWNSRVRRDQFRVVGTDGEIGMDPLSGLELRVGDRVERLPTHANVHYPLIENYVDALESGAALAAPGEQAMWTDWVIDQAMHLRATR